MFTKNITVTVEAHVLIFSRKYLLFPAISLSPPSSWCSLEEINYILPPIVEECDQQIVALKRTLSQVIFIKLTDLRDNLSLLRAQAMCRWSFFVVLLFAKFNNVGKILCRQKQSLLIK